MTEKSVSILDLGLGNLHSVARAFERAGAKPEVTADPDRVRRAARVVVPGQGAIRRCMEALSGGLGEALSEVIRDGRPYLGICLGMQALFESSEEAPEMGGLGVFAGKVVRFPAGLRDAAGNALKVPHMGWNQVTSRTPMIEDAGFYYFVHSFYCVPEDPSLVVATADYGAPFCVAVARDNVLACQFHPEKSHRAGARFVARFLEAR
jgi:glutamine amidotransferase